MNNLTLTEFMEVQMRQNIRIGILFMHNIIFKYL